MNGFLIAVLLILIGSAVIGYWRGLIRIAFSLISMVLLIVLVSWATPHITEFLKESTNIHQDLEETCTNRIRSSMEDTLNHYGEQLEVPGAARAEWEGELPIPKEWLEQVLEKTQDTVTHTAEESGLYQQAGSYLADWILQGIVFFVTYFLCSIVLRLAVGLLDVVARLPVIKGVNRALGAVAGLLQGLLLVWLLLFFVAIAYTSPFGQTLLAYIRESTVLSWLYQHNIILYLFHYMFGL